MELDEFSLMETVRDSAKYSDKIDELLKATKAYQKAKSDCEAAKADLAKRQTETDNYVNGRKADLAAAQLVHDKAAKEAADRIELAKSQVNEALRVQAENNKTSSDLDGRERALTEREKVVKIAEGALADRIVEINRKMDLANRVIAHINATPKA